MSKKPIVEIMNINPQMAREWLEHVVENNRKVRSNRIRVYAADMSAGRWHLGSQAIAFNCAGKLVNGQHRLHAVLVSGETITQIVLKNMDAEAMLIEDSGMKRSTDDNFTMSGREYPRGCGATVRKLFLGVGQFQTLAITDQEIDEFMANNGDSVEFAHECLSMGPFSRANIRAVIARAYLKRHPREKIRRFCEVLKTGMMVPGEEAIILLRNWLLSFNKAAGSTVGTRKGRKDLVGKAEQALWCYLHGEKVERLHGTKVELFPIRSIDGKGKGDDDDEEIQLHRNGKLEAVA